MLERLNSGGSAIRCVGRGQVLLAHAEAAVLDLDGVAVGDQLAADLDRGVRRRERDRVLDQLGEQVDDVADGPAGERRPSPIGSTLTRV